MNDSGCMCQHFISFFFIIAGICVTLYEKDHLIESTILQFIILQLLLTHDLFLFCVCFSDNVLCFFSFITYISFINLIFQPLNFVSIFVFSYSFFKTLLMANFLYDMNEIDDLLLEKMYSVPPVEDRMEECHICLENSVERPFVRKFHCRHFFHSECLVEWFKNTPDDILICPVCKQQLLRENLI